MKRLLVLLTLPLSLQAMEIFKSDKGFSIRDENGITKVHSYDIDPFLKKLDDERLTKFFQNGGYIKPKKLSNGDYKLYAKARLKGGGPYTAWVLYTLTKSFCYGSAVAAVGGAVAVTGGAVIGAAGAIAGTAGATGAGAVLATGGIVGGNAVAATTIGAAVATTPVGVIAGGLSASAGGMAVANTVTAVGLTASGGCLVTAAAGIEALSCGAFALGLACPFLP